MYKSKLLRRVLLGLFLGAVTEGLISFCATNLPFSQARDEITDALTVPAVLITQIFYPEGVDGACQRL